MYSRHSINASKIYWRCHHYSKRDPSERCRARCIQKDGKIQVMSGQHNHPAHTDKIQHLMNRQTKELSNVFNLNSGLESNVTNEPKTEQIENNTDWSHCQFY